MCALLLFMDLCQNDIGPNSLCAFFVRPRIKDLNLLRWNWYFFVRSQKVLEHWLQILLVSLIPTRKWDLTINWFKTFYRTRTSVTKKHIAGTNVDDKTNMSKQDLLLTQKCLTHLTQNELLLRPDTWTANSLRTCINYSLWPSTVCYTMFLLTCAISWIEFLSYCIEFIIKPCLKAFLMSTYTGDQMWVT